jgi:hypothetical protein
MISVTLKPDSNFLQSLTRHLDVLAQAAAREAADLLALKLIAGARSGIHHGKYPRRSSAPGEYPQQQFGGLRASVAATKNGRMSYRVGFFGENIYKLLDLEYGMGTITVSNDQPMNPGYNTGQRKPLYTLFIGKDGKATRRAMNSAAESVV